MEEDYYFSFKGRRKVLAMPTIVDILEDFVNKNYDNISDLSFRYGLRPLEMTKLIEKVLPSKEFSRPKIIVRQSKV